MTVEYSFITTWQTKAEVTEVWSAILFSEDWPIWWKDFIAVKEIVPGNDMGIGSVRRYILKSPSLYRLTFDLELTERVEYRLLKAASSGDLAGTGIWLFEKNNDITHIQCQWKVATNKTWMNIFAFILKPVFRYNHKVVMRNGARQLARKLGVEVATVI